MTTNPKPEFTQHVIDKDNEYYYYENFINHHEYYTRGRIDCSGLCLFHRTDGPAMIRNTGQKEYWLEGERWDEERFDSIESWVFNSKY